MKHRLLDVLCCPACRQALTLECFQDKTDGESIEIVEGLLRCVCRKTYPVIGGIPRMLPDRLLSECLHQHYGDFLRRHSDRFTAPPPPVQALDRKSRTMRAFGYQWTTFVDNFDYFRSLFLSFVHPFLAPEDFKNKLVLEVGCGSGRPASVACSLGAEVVAVDLSRAVETAYAQSGHYSNLHVVQADAYALPFRACFDFVYSVGVIQHLPDPVLALKSIANVVPADHRLVIWVYGVREFWYQPIEWLRKLTTRMPFPLLRGLSLVMAVLSEVLLLIPYRVLSKLTFTRRLSEKIPGRIYASLPFQENVLGWFDRLAAPVTYYFSRNQVADMLAAAGFSSIEIVARPGASASWVAQATRVR